MSLLAKTILFLPLVVLGAANLYLGSQRLRRLARRFRPGASPTMPRRFFRAVRAEVLLVGLVLLATGVLTSLSPPAQSSSAAPAIAFSETEETEEGKITLSVDPAVAGTNAIDVRFTDGDGPVTDASKVAVRLSIDSEGIAESESVAQAAGDGHYVLSGPQLSAPGTWRVEVVARRPGHDDARAVFEVPVAAPRVAEAEGVRAVLRSQPARPRAGEGTELELLVTDTSGKSLPGSRAGLTLLMPAHAHYEDVVLQDLGGGRYATYAQLTMSGEWVAQVAVERPGQPVVNLNIELDVAE
ncbi:MAG: FixH family protein, partial [Chloroflexota bacterium]|nr:FixH family protein [Chloroflexota bacterium]